MHGPGQSWSAGKLGRQTEVEEQVGRSPGGASRHHSTGHNTTPPPNSAVDKGCEPRVRLCGP